jgi:hypothetical protein
MQRGLTWTNIPAFSDWNIAEQREAASILKRLGLSPQEASRLFIKPVKPKGYMNQVFLRNNSPYPASAQIEGPIGQVYNGTMVVKGDVENVSLLPSAKGVAVLHIEGVGSVPVQAGHSYIIHGPSSRRRPSVHY